MLYSFPSPEPCPACSSPSCCLVDSAFVGKPNVYECEVHGLFEDGKLTRVRRCCTRCGHPESPSGGGHCDRFPVDEEGCPDACCDGVCTYPNETVTIAGHVAVKGSKAATVLRAAATILIATNGASAAVREDRERLVSDLLEIAKTSEGYTGISEGVFEVPASTPASTPSSVES